MTKEEFKKFVEQVIDAHVGAFTRAQGYDRTSDH